MIRHGSFRKFPDGQLDGGVCLPKYQGTRHFRPGANSLAVPSLKTNIQAPNLLL
jgi:hypothetical protein